MFLPYSKSFISHFLTFRAILDTMFPDTSFYSLIIFWFPFVCLHSLHPPRPTRGDFTPLLKLVHWVNSLSCIHCGEILAAVTIFFCAQRATVWIWQVSLANNMDITTRLWLPLIYTQTQRIKWTLENGIYWIVQIVTTEQNWYIILESQPIYKITRYQLVLDYRIISLTRSSGLQGAPRYQTVTPSSFCEVLHHLSYNVPLGGDGWLLGTIVVLV